MIPTTAAEMRRELAERIDAARDRHTRRRLAVDMVRPDLERLASSTPAVLELLDAYDAATAERDTYREMVHAMISEQARLDRTAGAS